MPGLVLSEMPPGSSAARIHKTILQRFFRSCLSFYLCLQIILEVLLLLQPLSNRLALAEYSENESGYLPALVRGVELKIKISAILLTCVSRFSTSVCCARLMAESQAGLHCHAGRYQWQLDVAPDSTSRLRHGTILLHHSQCICPRGLHFRVR